MVKNGLFIKKRLFESVLPNFKVAKIWWQYNDQIEIFQSHVLMEMWAPPDYFAWDLSSPVAKP